MKCPRCKNEMKVIQNCHLAIEMNSADEPIAVWYSDCYKCFACKYETISGLGQKPITEDRQEIRAILDSPSFCSYFPSTRGYHEKKR